MASDRLGGRVQLEDGARTQCLANGLRALGKEPPGLAAALPSGQTAGRGEPGVLELSSASLRRRSWRTAGALGRDGFLRDLGEDGERVRVGDGEVGQALAVDGDAGQPQALDEPVVGDVVRAGRGVDAGDPQLPEVALAGLAVAVLVGRGVEQLLLGLAVEPGALPPVSRCRFQGRPALLVGIHCPLDACHGMSFTFGPSGDGRD